MSIGGGNENQLIDNSILDVYDLGAEGWVKQATQGKHMTNPCSSCFADVLLLQGIPSGHVYLIALFVVRPK